ncbi:MAG: B-box zinc finger protein [Armatimonadota bacterium]|nr:B-box zinc finger protein [Armatimonadota bacterium]
MQVETPTYCARHPKEETAVRCASCETPICPKCMVSTPVGMKCRDCASNRQSVLYQVRPERFALAGIVSLIAGAGAAFLGAIGFFVIFVGTAYGYFAGSLILKASGMKRGTKLEVLAGAGMVIGALAMKVLSLIAIGKPGAVSAISLRFVLDPFFLIAVAISTACAVSKIRYL